MTLTAVERGGSASALRLPWSWSCLDSTGGDTVSSWGSSFTVSSPFPSSSWIERVPPPSSVKAPDIASETEQNAHIVIEVHPTYQTLSRSSDTRQDHLRPHPGTIVSLGASRVTWTFVTLWCGRLRHSRLDLNNVYVSSTSNLKSTNEKGRRTYTVDETEWWSGRDVFFHECGRMCPFARPGRRRGHLLFTGVSGDTYTALKENCISYRQVHDVRDIRRSNSGTKRITCIKRRRIGQIR